ncbi:uncharacterized protein GIQ15_04221 [Arthroderma uncinatum]|uniref:uncharacterized protein n=1 Tax=Arthroderma uncinatum TaxID=74035 RepID=UPI00144AA2ED|nr:uncharacterized protein GIQ15_04221 [Arthroderma uncinatum]KAF3481462.1 hypothetical protein GIQ15_04221 [Arthroderma uncinatum]
MEDFEDIPNLEELEEIINDEEGDLENFVKLEKEKDGIYRADIGVPITKTLMRNNMEYWAQQTMDINQSLLTTGRQYGGNIYHNSLRIYLMFANICLYHPHFLLHHKATIHIELKEPGEHHENAYCLTTKHDDKARRLAIKATGITEGGETVVEYLWSAGTMIAYKINSWIDKLEGIPVEEIARTKRRYLFLDPRNRPISGLEKYIGGGYTPDTTE